MWWDPNPTHATTDYNEWYYYSYYLNGPKCVFQSFNIKTQQNISDTIDGTMQYCPEYDRNKLWCVFSHGISYFDLNTRQMVAYDSIDYGPDSRNFDEWIFKSAFDHKNEVYFFLKYGSFANQRVDSLLVYHTRSKQLVRHRIIPPAGTVTYSFDYSPEDDILYCLATDMVTSRIYTLDYHNGAVAPHSSVLGMYSSNWMTIDTARNRLYFSKYRAGGPGSAAHEDTLSCYRINTRTIKDYRVVKSAMLHNLEFFDTYADTTFEFPLVVKHVSANDFLTLYPNPAHTVLNVLQRNDLKLELAVYDMAGRIVMPKWAMNGKQQVLDISALPPALYVLKAYWPRGELSQVFTIQR
jgi:hypothetical protein